jgi:hypothetical protein
MNPNLIRTNMTLIAIIIFLIVYSFVQYIKPGIFYNQDGSMRQFGVGYKNKTIFPLWLFAVILGIVSYLSILYYLEFQNYI